MPISQSRVITLIQIAETFKTELLTRQRAITAIISDIPPDAPRESLLRAVQLIQTYNSELTLSPAALDTLSTERAHFKLHAKRNARLAANARKRKGKLSPATTLSTSKLASPLAARKLDLNATYKQFNMPEPYPDPHNDSEPLLPEHSGDASATDNTQF